MVRIVVVVALLMLGWMVGPVDAQDHQHEAAGAGVAQPMAGLGTYHHRITTRSPRAQRLFDQGLVLVYGFNHGQAIRLFERAAELDPNAPMPLWGIALAYGPNINDFEISPRALRALRLTSRRPAGRRLLTYGSFPTEP